MIKNRLANFLDICCRFYTTDVWINRQTDRKNYKQKDKLIDKIINQQKNIINKVNHTERDPLKCRPQWCRHVKYSTEKQTGKKTKQSNLQVKKEKQKYTDSKTQRYKQTKKQKRVSEKTWHEVNEKEKLAQ